MPNFEQSAQSRQNELVNLTRFLCEIIYRGRTSENGKEIDEHLAAIPSKISEVFEDIPPNIKFRFFIEEDGRYAVTLSLDQKDSFLLDAILSKGL